MRGIETAGQTIQHHLVAGNEDLERASGEVLQRVAKLAHDRIDAFPLRGRLATYDRKGKVTP
jgi:hypothetical protein